MRCGVAWAVWLVLAACEPARQQHEITAPGELLTADGRLREPGWAPRELLHWDPARVHDPKRLRAWDFFTIQSGSAAVNLTLFDLGFIQLASVGVVNFTTGITTGTQNLNGLLVLSPALDGEASYRVNPASAPQMTFSTSAGTTAVTIDIPAVFGPAAHGSFTIHRRLSMPFLSAATPFADDATEFFYEQKLPGLTAEGSVTIGDQTWSFDPGASAVMDWGRGEWPAQATWRWAGGSGTVAGAPLAFNLGEGFGDDRYATENLVIYDDVPNKLGRVSWSYQAGNLLADWTLKSDDGRLALVLHPVAPETGGINLGDKYSKLHKGYGTWSGTIRLDDGRTLAVSGLPGFAEEEELSW